MRARQRRLQNLPQCGADYGRLLKFTFEKRPETRERIHVSTYPTYPYPSTTYSRQQKSRPAEGPTFWRVGYERARVATRRNKSVHQYRGNL